ncbi:tRNA (adenosine(37)-N6)-threonylcarbamoyltransferase complex transferase subunit TsaD [Candidatus Palauibacter sp.]|uniref:tRNA (adenosine(37)-N6)-threonylcarbamoyltransferase complex transferase subunit TsaD n=1 Tax=Candidatus Palauibacter sp. TaxID=3101350 RepID=UPI003B59E3A2
MAPVAAFRGGPVLGIETSCDETSAAVVDESGIRGLAIASQDAHAAFGGVVPEIAAREHIRSLDAMVRHAMREAEVDHADIAGVGVTAGPGLVGALLAGVNWAKAYAFARGLPLLGVHHMEGHLFGTALEHEGAQPPFIGLLVSGGHTLLLEARAWGRYRLLGQTRDDAAGEAFDKVARRLGLPYPGGPQIQRAAERSAATGGAADGGAGRFRLPRPMLSRRDLPGDPAYYDMSFSGLKTAVARIAEQLEEEGVLADAVDDLAADFQEAVVDVLAEKTRRAVEQTGCRRVVLGGGVARNSRLREGLAERLGSSGELYAPSPRLATDNAAMIAAAALFRLARGERSPWSLNAEAALAFPGLA